MFGRLFRWLNPPPNSVQAANLGAAVFNCGKIVQKAGDAGCRRETIALERAAFDETWVKTNRAPLRGWGPKGRRLVAKTPHSHWKTLTFIAALRCDRIDAPLVIEGPINDESFAAYVEQVLVPTLKEGDIVVLDNLSSHRKQASVP